MILKNKYTTNTLNNIICLREKKKEIIVETLKRAHLQILLTIIQLINFYLFFQQQQNKKLLLYFY